MDCKSIRALKDVPADKVSDYLACLQPTAAGNIQEQALDGVIQGQAWSGVALFFFVILCVLAVWQLLWTKSHDKTFWSCTLGLGLLGLGFLLQL